MPEPLRYVVLFHDGIERPHFDLMFETAPGSKLATWRSSEWPVSERATLEPLAEHRREYLTLEGPLSGNRGAVRRVAEGRHRTLEDAPSVLVVELEHGQVIRLPRQ